ncbi:MAG TPA: DUF1330 domain-containing protein [Steroidobacteraceae bacterium]|nr:DUF1330 domain-containing protein [Steroidobacteraceae bacterium]
MSVYVVAQITIHDRAGYSRYEEGFLGVFQLFKGELLAVSENPTVVEGQWPCTRTVLIRFPSQEEAARWYQSPEYQAIAQHRFRASTGNAVIVEGLTSS